MTRKPEPWLLRSKISGMITWVFASIIILSILFLMHLQQAQSTHFQYGDWVKGYDGTITLSTVMAFRAEFFGSVNVGSTQHVGNYGIVGGTEISSKNAYSNDDNVVVKLKVENVYQDPLPSEDQWSGQISYGNYFFGTETRLIQPHRSSDTRGIGNVSSTAQRVGLYFTRCCRVNSVEEIRGVDGDTSSGGASIVAVWIDRRRTYSITTRTFPRESVNYQENITNLNWVLPNINREDPYHPYGAFVRLSPSSRTGHSNGDGISGIQWTGQSGTTPYFPGIKASGDERLTLIPGVFNKDDRSQDKFWGGLNWKPNPSNLSSFRTNKCSAITKANKDYTAICAYVVSFLVEDRLFQSDFTVTSTSSNRIGAQVDFLFIVKHKCVPGSGQECPPEFNQGAGTYYVTPTIPFSIRYSVSGSDKSTVQIQHDPPPQNIFLEVSDGFLGNSGKNIIDIIFDTDIDGVKGALICLKATTSTGLISIGTQCPRFIVTSPDYMFLTGTMRSFDTMPTSPQLSLNFNKAALTPDRKPIVISGNDKSIFDNWWNQNSSVKSTTLSTLVMTRSVNSATDPYSPKTNAQNQPIPPIPRVYSVLRPWWPGKDEPHTQMGYYTYEAHTSMDLLDTETLAFGITGGELFVYINDILVIELSYYNPPTGTTGQPTPRTQDFDRTDNVNWVKKLTSTQIRTMISKPKSPTLTAADNYNIDIFYTHRNKVTDGFFIEFANSTACSPLAVLRGAEQWKELADAAVIFEHTRTNWNNLQDFSQAHSITKFVSGKGLLLIDGATTSTSTTLFTKQKLKILSGFETKFSFTMENKTSGTRTPIYKDVSTCTPWWSNSNCVTTQVLDGYIDTPAVPPPGFAFVIQNQGSTSRGADASGLGYGGLHNAIAIEFDCLSDASPDISGCHISAHRPNEQGVTNQHENSDSQPIGTVPTVSTPQLPLNFYNNTEHRITVTLSPTASQWWLYVYVNDNIKPLYTAQFSHLDMQKWFGIGGGFMGFTTSNTASSYGDVYINSFSTTIIPPLARNSKPTTSPSNGIYYATAGESLTIRIQLADACSVPVQSEGHEIFFKGKFRHRFASDKLQKPDITLPVDELDAVITGRGLGLYDLSATVLRNGYYDIFIYYQEVTGKYQPLGFEPMDFSSANGMIPDEFYITTSKAYTGRIDPSRPFPSKSDFIFGKMPLSLSNTNNPSFFDNANTAGVACYPSQSDGSLVNPTDTLQGGIFTTLSDYTTWMDQLPSSTYYIHCVNRGQYIGQIKSIIDSAYGTGLSTSSQDISAVWILSRNENDGFSLNSPLHFQWNDKSAQVSRIELYRTPQGSTTPVLMMTSFLESAPIRWTSQINTGNGRGSIIFHPTAFVVPSDSKASFPILLRDQFGNPLTNNQYVGDFTHTVVPSLKSSEIGQNPMVQNEPFWPFNFESSIPGSHLASIYFPWGQDTIQIGKSSGSIIVSAGAAHYSTSQPNAVTVSGSVDTLMSFSIKLYDITPFHVAEQTNKEEITAVDWISTILDSNGNESPRVKTIAVGEPENDLDGYTPHDFWDQSTQQYEFKYTPKFAGTFFVKIYINSVCTPTWSSPTHDCNRNPEFELSLTRGQILAITAGPPAISSVLNQIIETSSISMTDTDRYVSGNTVIYTIQSRDRYGNDRYTGNPSNVQYRLQLFTHDQFTTPITSTTTFNSALINSTPSQSYIIFDHVGSGMFQAQITYKIAQNLFIGVVLYTPVPSFEPGTTTPVLAENGIILTDASISTPNSQIDPQNKAKSTVLIVPGAISEKSIFEMWLPTNPQTSKLIGNIADNDSYYTATSQGTDNVWFSIKPRDFYNNVIFAGDITETIFTQFLSLQYVTSTDVYYFAFTKTYIGSTNDGLRIIGSFNTQVAGEYEINVTTVSTGNTLDVIHSTFIVVASIPSPPIMSPSVQWPSDASGLVTFTDIDVFSNLRREPSIAFTYTLYHFIGDISTCSTSTMTSTQCSIITDGERPQYQCQKSDAIVAQPNNFLIVPNLPQCLTQQQRCTSECSISTHFDSEDVGTTNAFVSGIRYYSTIDEPSNPDTTATFTPMTSMNGSIMEFKYDLNQFNLYTIAGTWMYIYVIEPEIFISPTRQLTLDPGTVLNKSALFTSISATVSECSQDINMYNIPYCNELAVGVKHRAYRFKIQYKISPNSSQHLEFFIKYRLKSSVNAVDQYKFNIVPGQFSPIQSQWTGITSDSIAGKNFAQIFIPRDIYGNNIISTDQWNRSSINYQFGVYTRPTPSSTTFNLRTNALCQWTASQTSAPYTITCTTTDLNYLSSNPLPAFTIATLEAFHIGGFFLPSGGSSAGSIPSLIDVSTQSIGRTLRTQRIISAQLSMVQSFLTLGPGDTAILSNSQTIISNENFNIFFIARDQYNNPTAYYKSSNGQSDVNIDDNISIIIKYGDKLNAVIQSSSWILVSRNIFVTRILINDVSRSGKVLTANLFTSSTPNAIMSVISQSPAFLPPSLDHSPVDNSDGFNLSLLYSDSSTTTPFDLTDATVDTQHLSYYLKVLDQTGLTFIQNLPTTQNPYPDDTSLLQIELQHVTTSSSGTITNQSMPVTIKQVRSNPTNINSPVVDGLFELILPTLTKATGIYNLKISFSRRTIAFYSFKIGHGEPKIDFTTMVERTTTFASGQIGFISFKLYDRYYNPISTPDIIMTPSTADLNPVIKPTIGKKIIPSFHSGRPICNADIHDFTPYYPSYLWYALPQLTHQRQPDFDFNSVQFDNIDTYKVLFTPSPSGSYSFNLTYVQEVNNRGFIPTSNDHVFSCTTMAPFSFDVETGPPHSSKSYYTITPGPKSTMPNSNTGFAGQTYIIDLFLLDIDGSPAKIDTETSLFWDIESPSSMDIEKDLYNDPTAQFDQVTGELLPGSETKSNLLSFKFENLTSIFGLGRHRWTIRPRIASQINGSFNFKIKMKDVVMGQSDTWHVISGSDPSKTPIQQPIRHFTVLHGPPSKVIPTDIKSNIIAGEEYQFTATSIDLYGNLITSDQFSRLTITIIRTGSSMESPLVPIESLQYPLQPSQVVTTSQGESTITFVPSWEGLYTIEVNMVDKVTGQFLASQTIPDLNNLSQYPQITVLHATCAGRYLSTHGSITELNKIPLFFCQKSQECVFNLVDCTDPLDIIQCKIGESFVGTSCISLPIWAPNPEDPLDQPDPSDYISCQGAFIPATQPCPLTPNCPTGTVQCPDNNGCRSSLSLCPSKTACSPGLMICPNNLSCAVSLSDCPTIPQTVIDKCTAENGILCTSGVCVSSHGECPTQSTCPIGKVRCLSDGSCQENVQKCPSLPPSQIKTPEICKNELFLSSSSSESAILCPDGRSCALKLSNCPSSITCPVGSALCAIDNACHTASCPVLPPTNNQGEIIDPNPTVYPNPSSSICAVTEFRCTTGQCVQNLMLCPSKPSCGEETPILCSDLTCKESLAVCNQPKPCSDSNLLQCTSTGSCVTDLKYCSSPKKCPINKPVLCSGGDCADSIENCQKSLECPPSLPFLCPSGNCRGSISDCPSLIGCPITSPLRCDDNSCVITSDLCKSSTELINPVTGQPEQDSSITKCPSTLIKCPTGECSSALLTCPTHITCPLSTSRCPDGQCRSQCPIDSNTGIATDVPTCSSRGLITCPISSTGYSCARSISECPQGITCPLSQPVKCPYDATCSISIEDCSPKPSIEPPTSKIPCFDGSWVFGTSQADCPTAVTCTPNQPIKCSDSSCKSTVNQCPIALPCNDESSPYRCTNGQCVSAPWDCQPVLDGGIVCPASTPIKCPVYQGIAKCVDNITKCDTYRNPDGTKPDNDDGNDGEDEVINPYISPCSPGFTYCRDGSCQESPNSCPIFSCGVAFPYLCSDGSCAQNQKKCNNFQTGCPWDKPHRCPGTGQCVLQLSSCQRSTCPEGTNACIDGTCKEICNLAANGCPVSQFRCADGSCVSDSIFCTSESNINFSNSCPPGVPIRCGNGLCVEKQYQCTILSTENIPNCPILCADGTCKDSTELCPLVKPCNGDNIRCGDGSCRLESDCPTWKSFCPEGLIRCRQDEHFYPILDGLCAPPGECLLTNGCPLQNNLEQYRCEENGRCVLDKSLCLVNLPSQNGCSPDRPVKCWDSSCSSSSLLCPQTNGCPANKPIRCTNGDCISKTDTCTAEQLLTCSEDKHLCADGSCVTHISDCNTSFGCPIDKPVRCYNGDCRPLSSKYRSPIYGLSNAEINALTCPPVVSCPSTSYIMCADSSCVLSQSLCPSTSYKCAANEFRCVDGSCRPSTSLCGFELEIDENGVPTTNWIPSTSKPSQCPVTLPVMCPDSGQCVQDNSSCNNNANPETTNITGSSSAPTKDQNKPFQTQCFDGSWVDSYAKCREIAKTVNDKVQDDAINGGGGGGSEPVIVAKCVDFCPNGRCLTAGQNPQLICDLIPACPIGKMRCYNGSCLDSCEGIEPIDCSAQLGEDYDETLHIPNIDGICRSRELSIGYRGCSSEPNERYHCQNRECAKNSADCWVVSEITNSDELAKKRSEFSPFSIKIRLEEEAKRRQQNSNKNEIFFNNKNLKPQLFEFIPNGIIADIIEEQSTIHLSTFSSTQTTPSTDNDGETPGGNDDDNDDRPDNAINRSCINNCIASNSVNPTNILYSPSTGSQTYNIAPLSTGATLQIYSGLNVDQSNDQDMTLTIIPVGHNVYYNATNRLTYSRIEQFSGIQGLTSAQTVLSPVFSCHVGNGIIEPFNIGIKFSSLIDRSMIPTPQPHDICLARLRRFPQHNYQVWMCEFTEEQRTSGDLQYSTRQSPEQPLRQAISFISRCSDPDFNDVSASSSSSVNNHAAVSHHGIGAAAADDDDDDETMAQNAMNLLQSSGNDDNDDSLIKVPAIYAFIHSPVASGQFYLPAKDTFWRDNVIWLLFVIIGGLLLLFVLAYALMRLSRYSKKTDKIKKELVETEKEVVEMEQFGNKNRDIEVRYMANPLAVGLQQEKDLLSNNEEAMLKKQLKLTQAQNQQNERKEVIDSLEAENEAALAHLELLKKKASRPHNVQSSPSNGSIIGSTSNVDVQNSPSNGSVVGGE